MYRRSHEHFRTIRAADDAYFAARKNETIRLPFLDQTQPDNSDLFWHLAKPAAMFSTAAVIATFASIALEAPRPAAAQGPTTEPAKNPNVVKVTFGDWLKSDNPDANEFQNTLRAVAGITIPQGSWVENFRTHLEFRAKGKNCLDHSLDMAEQALNLILNTPITDLAAQGWQVFLRPGTTDNFLYTRPLPNGSTEFLWSNPTAVRSGKAGTHFITEPGTVYKKLPTEPLSGDALKNAHSTVQNRIGKTDIDSNTQNCRGDAGGGETAPATNPN